MHQSAKQRIKRILSVLLTGILLVSAFPAALYAGEAQADVTIASLSDLLTFAADVNAGNDYAGKTVSLTANLDLGGENSPWTPIGTPETPFKGSFDGGYHTVSGLSIAAGNDAGLFGYVYGGTVENLVVSGEVSGNTAVAGIVGALRAGTVRNCGNASQVSGVTGVGGVVGSLTGACSVEGCFNTGAVTGTTGYIGGVAGQLPTSGTVTVQNCYNTGIVSGPATVGGVVGGHKRASVTLANCFHGGTVTDTAQSRNNIGTLLGAVKSGSAENCYDLTDSALPVYGSGVQETGAERKAELTAAELGAAFVDGKAMPALAWEEEIHQEAATGPAFTEATKLSAELAGYIRAAVLSAKAQAGIGAADSLLGDADYAGGASSTETDWMALAMGRFGYYDGDGNYQWMIDDGDGYGTYLEALRQYIETTYAQNSGLLHRVKATEWHRAVVTVGALLGDPLSFGTYNGSPINLVADGSYDCVIGRGPGAQGINGWIWGLLAMDVQEYALPESAQYSRERFITEILRMQLTDGVNGNAWGGWVLGGYGSSSDVDITAMAIQALAPYYNDDTVYTYTNANSGEQVSRTVRQCVDEALDRLGSMLDEDAGFSSWGTDNVESTSQVLVALTALGIDPAEDARFITKDGKTLLDGILRFRTENGGFGHVAGGGWNSMANDQVTYALVAYWRYENGMRALYDMREDMRADDRAAVDAAMEAISRIPAPSSGEYRERVRAALEAFEAVDRAENRYVTNYPALYDALRIIGGRAGLESDAPFITGIEIAGQPDRTVYYEGEMFEASGLTVRAFYSDGTSRICEDYTLSADRALALGDDTVYVRVGVFQAPVSVTVLEKMPWEGEGTKAVPYRITDGQELAALAEKTNEGNDFKDVHFILTDNIDLSDIGDWMPIGRSGAQFDGHFDGNGYAVDNLCSTQGGLFGYAGVDAVIENVGLASGEITGNASFVGGIAGWSNGADIINCWNGADIAAGGYSGGIVGTVRDGGESRITGCYNTGSVAPQGYSRNAVGGIVGHIAASRTGTDVQVRIENCYNVGSIVGDSMVGGIAGQLQDGHTVRNCYNAGAVTADGVVRMADGTELPGYAGGIVGSITSGSVVADSYYDAGLTKTGAGNGADTATAKTAQEMQDASFLDLLGEAFQEDLSDLVNGGYPLLYWQRTGDTEEETTPEEETSEEETTQDAETTGDTEETTDARETASEEETAAKSTETTDDPSDNVSADAGGRTAACLLLLLGGAAALTLAASEFEKGGLK